MTIKSPLTTREVLDSLIKTSYIQKYLGYLRLCDKDTRAHSVRVAKIATDLGIEEGLNVWQLKTLCLAALLHDIGKADVDQDLLHASRRLTRQEKREIDRHASFGARKIRGEHLRKVREIVRHHHDFQKGKELPTAKRRKGSVAHLTEIVSAADIFDALRSARSYKLPYSRRKVARIMQSEFTGSKALVHKTLERY